jgi:hypothetical protein
MKIIIGKYEGTIYAEGNGYTGAIELAVNGKGDRNRLKRKGRSKEIVKASSRRPSANWKPASRPVTVTRLRKPSATG